MISSPDFNINKLLIQAREGAWNVTILTLQGRWHSNFFALEFFNLHFKERNVSASQCAIFVNVKIKVHALHAGNPGSILRVFMFEKTAVGKKDNQMNCTVCEMEIRASHLIGMCFQDPQPTQGFILKIINFLCEMSYELYNKIKYSLAFFCCQDDNFKLDRVEHNT